jgi:hypothetical protein
MRSERDNLMLAFIRRFGLLGGLIAFGALAVVGVVMLVLLRAVLGQVGGTLVGAGLVLALFLVLAMLQSNAKIKPLRD